MCGPLSVTLKCVVLCGVRVCGSSASRSGSAWDLCACRA